GSLWSILRSAAKPCAPRGGRRASCRCRSGFPRTGSACASTSRRAGERPLPESISDRKRSHLELCLAEDVEYGAKTTLFEEVELIHDALPELAVDEVDVSTELLG